MLFLWVLRANHAARAPATLTYFNQYRFRAPINLKTKGVKVCFENMF